MRWRQLQIIEGEDAAPPLIGPGAVRRTFDTPEFAGLTFYEIQARSIVNKVSKASRVPFGYTINPYRGCSHACKYCFARKTHEYLDLDSGADFDSKVIVKVNASQLLRKELAAPRWSGDSIAMGTNVDPYQRAEGRYRLMPGIIEALRDAANPFSILTKGTMVLRDVELLSQAAQVARVGAAVSVGFVDADMWRAVEPGTPRPSARLDACARLNAAGVECGVLIAPILPYLTDSHAQLRATVAACAEAGAVSVTPIPLHLRPGAREWYLAWLREYAPELMPRYRDLYARGSYAAKSYQRRVVAEVKELAAEHRIGEGRPHRPPPPPPRPRGAEPLEQPTLF
ncbi:MAG: Rv2578c family radical SAM protein [Stackebrandtia sp.]